MIWSLNLISLKKIFFYSDQFFQVFIEFVMILFLFYVLVFGCQAWGILPPQPGIEPAPPPLEGSLNYWITRKIPKLYLTWLF